ncbi:MAG: DNA-processing protein DprA [Acidimicrobiia bacterium]
MTTVQSKAVIALASRLGESKRPSLSPLKWSRFSTTLNDLGIDIGSVFDDGFDAASLEGIEPDTAATVMELLDTAAAATIEASEIERYGISVVTIVGDAYPTVLIERLGSLAPPVLFVVGNRGLLGGDGIGIVGSRNVTPEGKEASEDIARATVSLGRSVVSGAARGVDTFAMNAAFLAGGTVIGVVADALRSRIRKPEVLRAIDDDSVCLVSQQHPSAGFTPASAMSRNKLVYALSETTVVVATDVDTGGTWAGATEALKKNYCDIAAWVGDGAGPGNAALVQRGARPIDSVDQLLDGTRAEEAEQLTLTELP